MRFSLCHASCRPAEVWHPTVDQWFAKADDPRFVEHILVMGDRPVHQWNRAAHLSVGEILVMLADDLFPPDHWDTLLWNKRIDVGVSLSRASVFDVGYTDDNPCYPLIAHPIINRAYYNLFGYLLHPDYHGLMGDVEFTDVAREQHADCIIDCQDIKLRHLNPEKGTVAWDDTYRKHRAGISQAQEIYAHRKAAGFPIASIFAEATK